MVVKFLYYTVDVCQLSPTFYAAYPKDKYPEILRKYERPYTCLLLEIYNNFVCIPFRSSIKHDEAFIFQNSSRSKKSRSGLDYKKSVIIDNMSYVEFNGRAIVDSDEYTDTMRNLHIIVSEITRYIDTYIKHVNGKRQLHIRDYNRKYQFSTLPYFHDLLGLK